MSGPWAYDSKICLPKPASFFLVFVCARCAVFQSPPFHIQVPTLLIIDTTYTFYCITLGGIPILGHAEPTIVASIGKWVVGAAIGDSIGGAH